MLDLLLLESLPSPTKFHFEMQSRSLLSLTSQCQVFVPANIILSCMCAHTNLTTYDPASVNLKPVARVFSGNIRTSDFVSKFVICNSSLVSDTVCENPISTHVISWMSWLFSLMPL